jgi:hypothetical protein
MTTHQPNGSEPRQATSEIDGWRVRAETHEGSSQGAVNWITERPLAAMTSLYWSSVLMMVAGILGCSSVVLEEGLKVVCERVG